MAVNVVFNPETQTYVRAGSSDDTGNTIKPETFGKTAEEVRSERVRRARQIQEQPEIISKIVMDGKETTLRSSEMFAEKLKVAVAEENQRLEKQFQEQTQNKNILQDVYKSQTGVSKQEIKTPDYATRTTLREEPRKDFFSRVRTSISKERQKAIKSDSKLQQLKVLGLGLATPIIDVSQFATQFFKSPIQTTKQIGLGIKEGARRVKTGTGFPEVSQIIRTEPAFSTGLIFGEILTLKGASRFILKGEDFLESASVKLSKNSFPTPKEGEVVKFTDDLQVTFKKRGVKSDKSLQQSIPEQIKQAGKEAQPVSAQKSLFSTIKKKVSIDKPKPTPDAPELERAFFADPRGQARTKRLNLKQKPAELTDILAGDVKFRRDKPQILVFKKQKVAEFPEELTDIKTKLSKGETLTPQELKRLEAFQLTPTGKFKPLGFVTKESEIILAPKEVIVKEGKLGTTLIDGRKVDIFEASVKKAPDDVAKSLELIERKKGLDVPQRDIKKVEEFTGLSVRPDTRRTLPRTLIAPRLTPRKSIAPRLTPRTSIAPRLTPRTSIAPRLTPRKLINQRPKPIISINQRPIPRPDPRPTPIKLINQRPKPIISINQRPIPRPDPRPTPKNQIKPPKFNRPKKAIKSKEKPAYNVFVRERDKWRKIESNVPKNTAYNTGASYTDNNPTTKFKLVQKGKTKQADQTQTFINYKFSKSNNVYNEKKKYQKDSLGEVKKNEFF